MSSSDRLPEAVAALIRSASFAEFATMSAAGVPIDTPLLSFPEDDLSRIGMATGVSYPAKAERVRRNPRVGLLYEGALPGEPAAVSIAGIAAVRDSDIQANVTRYVAETAFISDQSIPWAVKREAVWYWARILIDIVPVQILWWDSAADLAGPPRRWNAPVGTVFPESDPAPPGSPTPAPQWVRRPWRELAAEALSRNQSGHLSLVDAEGYPRPIRTTSLRGARDGFVLTIPEHAPGERTGLATLTFFGRETFVGRVAPGAGGALELRVERVLPILPLVADTNETWYPSPEIHAALYGRLTAELSRRGQAVPHIAEDLVLTPAAQRRQARDIALSRTSIEQIAAASDATTAP